MVANAPPPTWHNDLRLLSRWFVAYLALWLAFWAALLGGASEDADAMLVVALLVPYVASIVYAYRIQREFNRVGVYKPGAWQVIAGALLLNPVVVGGFIPLSVIWVARRVARVHAA